MSNPCPSIGVAVLAAVDGPTPLRCCLCEGHGGNHRFQMQWGDDPWDARDDDAVESLAAADAPDHSPVPLGDLRALWKRYVAAREEMWQHRHRADRLEANASDADADAVTVPQSNVRDRLESQWGPRIADAVLADPVYRAQFLKFLGIEYRDGQFYDLSRRSPQGGRKEQDA